MKHLRLEVSVSSNPNNQYQPIKNNKFIFAYINMSRIELRYEFLIEDGRLSLANHIFHELGHFIIVPKSRRSKVNFGYNAKVNKKTSIKYELEEVKATMIQNELKRLFGFSYRNNLYGGSNVDYSFIQNNKEKIMNWWETEGRLLAKTYADLS